MSVRDFYSYINTTQMHRVAVVLLIILLGIGLGVGFSVASSDARNKADADYNRRLAIFSKWQMDLTSHFTKAGSLAATTGAFVATTALNPANLSAPALDRRIFYDQNALNRLGSQVMIAGVTNMIISPGAVNTQCYPVGACTLNFAVLESPTYMHLAKTLYNSTKILVSGPNKLATRPGYGSIVWFPVHVSNVTSPATFWGVCYVLIETTALVRGLNLTASMDAQNMDYVMWFTTVANGTMPTVIASTNTSASDIQIVMDQGMRMSLPISEEGRSAYFAMYPRGGPVSSSMKISTIIIVLVATILGSNAIVALVYIGAHCHFLFRHRYAPDSRTHMYIAAFALRGAQPVADRAPLEAVRMFNDFNVSVRKLATQYGCYPICEIGDRCVYVASHNPEDLMRLSQAAVLEISVQGSVTQLAPATTDAHSHQSHSRIRRPRSPSCQRSTSYARTAPTVSRTALTSVSHLSEEMTQSSFIGTTTCHPSVACHTINTHCIYDAARDVYFYGSAAQLGKLGSALDMAKSGEVCWTSAFEERCQKACRTAASSALTSHTVSENGEIVLHVASWWKETGDERDNEDPSTAMAVLSDAYVRRMTVIVSEGKMESKERRRKGDHGADTKSGSSAKSEATALTRTATLLHIAILDGDEKTALETIRRIVTDEKGTIVSAHESKIVAAFNLLSAGGHHQIRAADTVLRLRQQLPSTRFVCSIQQGKVNALIMDGLVMCTGEAVTQGLALLQTAIAMNASGGTTSPLPQAYSGIDEVTFLSSDNSVIAANKWEMQGSVTKRRSEIVQGNGLCLFFCFSELSAAYDCEAVDITTSLTGKPKVLFRLAHRKSTKATDDEWMYRLKDEEDQSPYAAVNAVFARIACHDIEDATRLWREHVAAEGGVLLSEISIYARASISKYLKLK